MSFCGWGKPTAECMNKNSKLHDNMKEFESTTLSHIYDILVPEKEKIDEQSNGAI